MVLPGTTFEDAWRKRYAGLGPANPVQRQTTSLIGTGRIEHMLPPIRNEHGAAPA
jgi:hypothetical protein